MKAWVMVLLTLALVACGQSEDKSDKSKVSEQNMSDKEQKERLYGSFAYGPYEGKVLFPEADPNFSWDEGRKAVIDSTTGEYLTGGGRGTSSDREISFSLRSREGKVLYNFQAYAGSYDKPGYGNTTAYQIIRVYAGGRFRYGDHLPESQYDLQRFARFVNQYHGLLGAGKNADNAVIVDVRTTWAEIWEKRASPARPAGDESLRELSENTETKGEA